MISLSSVLSALFFYSCTLLAVCVLCRVTPFLKIGGGYILLLASFVAALRLFAAIEIPFTSVVRSWTILGVPQRYLQNHPDVTRALLWVWGIGAVLFILWDLLMLYLAHRECDDYIEVESERVQEIKERYEIDCPVKVSPNVEVPFVLGIVNYTIYLPYPELSDLETEMVLRHEIAHIKAHDVGIKLFFGLLSAAMWWNPLVYPFRRAIDTILEYRCDANVTKEMDKATETQYLEALSNVAARVVSRKRRPVLALNESFAVAASKSKKKRETDIERRFKVVIAARKGEAPQWKKTVALCVLAVLFCASYFVIFAPVGAPPAETFQSDSRTYYHESYDGFEIEEAGIQDSTSSTFIFKGSDGRYQLFINYKFVRYLTEAEISSEKYEHLYIFEEGVRE